MTKSHIVIAGGSGMLGQWCQTVFEREGYEVIILTRRKKTRRGEVSWDPSAGTIAHDVISGAAAVINFCGLSLADHRWTKRYKKQLFESRTIPAGVLGKLIHNAKEPPQCYIGASGIGIYGDYGGQPIYDDSEISSTGFVADLVRAWEAAHYQVKNTRVVVFRIGVVLSPQGGFMGKLILPARFGMFPFFGSGKQILSWIHIDDLAGILLHSMQTTTISGTLHATAPGSVPQKELMKVYKTAKRQRGIVFGIPAILMKIGLGELSTVIFESANVQPDKILKSGFVHHYPDITSALQSVVKLQST